MFLLWYEFNQISNLLVRDLITPEIRCVIKHASFLGDECTNPSSSFTTFAYYKLINASVLSNMTLDQFKVCDGDHLAQLQKVLGFTTSVNENVTYKDFVTVTSTTLIDKLHKYYDDEDINGEFVSLRQPHHPFLWKSN
jgi:hypothetical protein